MLISAVVVCVISAASTLFGAPFAYVMLGVSVIGFALCIIFRRRSVPYRLIVVTFVAALFSISCLFTLNTVNKTRELIGETVDITGYVAEEPEYGNGYTIYTVKTDSVDLPGAEQNIKLRIISFMGEGIDAFENVSATVTLNDVSEEYRLSNYADGIFLEAETENLTVAEGVHKSLYYYAVSVRRAIRNIVYDNLPYEEASVICGIMLGDKSAISDDLYSDFTETGIVHIVTVSGLHLSIICYTLLKLLRKFGISRNVTALITALAVLVVMAITGFSPSILRASFMFLLLLLGQLIYREPDSLNLLGCAVVIILFIDPKLIFSVQLQLSSLSTLGIIVGIPLVEKYILSRIKVDGILKKLINYTVIASFQSIAATVATLPAVCLSIGRLSLISPLASVLLIYPSTVILTVSVAAVIISFVPFLMFISKPLFLVSGLATKLFIYIVRALASIPYSNIGINGEQFITTVLLCALLIVTVCLLYPNRRTVTITAVGTAFVIAVNLLVNIVMGSSSINVSVLSCSSGSSATVIDNSGHAVVICPDLDNMDMYRLRGIITDKGINTIDTLIMTDTGLLKETDYLLENFTVHCLVVPQKDKTETFNTLDNITVTELENSDFELWGMVKITQYTDSNGVSFLIENSKTAFGITFPNNSAITLPERFERSHAVIINPPYPDTVPDYIHEGVTFLTSSQDITSYMYQAFADSDSIVTMGVGDVLTFSMNRKIEVK